MKLFHPSIFRNFFVFSVLAGCIGYCSINRLLRFETIPEGKKVRSNNYDGSHRFTNFKTLNNSTAQSHSGAEIEQVAAKFEASVSSENHPLSQTKSDALAQIHVQGDSGSKQALGSSQPEPEVAVPSRVASRWVPALGSAEQNSSLHPVSQPAVWADLGDKVAPNTERDLAIQKDADNLVSEIKASGFAPDSMNYRNLWESSVADSDQRFRQHYGDQVWLAHHIQAHHLAAEKADQP